MGWALVESRGFGGKGKGSGREVPVSRDQRSVYFREVRPKLRMHSSNVCKRGLLIN